MESIFRKSWRQVGVEDIEAFLAEATEEGLTWEAKGGEWPRPPSVRKSVCGFANRIGGYLIVGTAGGATEGWTLRGLPFQRGDEPAAWLTSVLDHRGVHPLPPVDVKTWKRDDGLWVAVVEVQPVTAPPSMTSEGIVYQRVTGRTVPVTDQGVLADLFRRGETARTQAEGFALRAATRLLSEAPIFTSDDAVMAVALSPVAGPIDKAAALFSQTYVNSLREVHARQLQADPMLSYPSTERVGQDFVLARPGSAELGASWCAAAYWDGSAAVLFSDTSNEVLPTELTNARLPQAWNALAELVHGMGGHGEAHFVLRLNPRHRAFANRHLPEGNAIRRWTEARKPHAEELASVEREVGRMFGTFALEPEAHRSDSPTGHA